MNRHLREPRYSDCGRITVFPSMRLADFLANKALVLPYHGQLYEFDTGIALRSVNRNHFAQIYLPRCCHDRF